MKFSIYFNVFVKLSIGIEKYNSLAFQADRWLCI
jgi:hypothetical protein